MAACNSRRMEIKPKSVLILDASHLHLRTSRSSSVQHAEEGIYGKALHPEEIRDAEEDIICKVQSEIFPEECKALKSKKAISPKSPLIKLPPRIDENGIIRMDGR